MKVLLIPMVLQKRSTMIRYHTTRKSPLFACFLLCAVMGTFKGYPSVGDAALYLGLLPVCSEIFKCKRLLRQLSEYVWACATSENILLIVPIICFIRHALLVPDCELVHVLVNFGAHFLVPLGVPWKRERQFLLRHRTGLWHWRSHPAY